MNQVSRPMQFLLGGVVLFAVVWFVALKPKTPVEEPIAAQPATQTAPPATAAGGEQASSAVGKTIESANNAAASANQAAAKSEAQTGEADASSSAPADTSASSDPSSAASAPADAAEPKTGAAASSETGQATKPGEEEAEKATESPAQTKANRVIRSIKRDLAARRAAVVLVYQAKGKEDQILYKRIKKDIDRRGGRVRTYFIHVSQVGYYEGLLSGLNLAQTPSTIVIAPDNQAKVLPGLSSTARIDRLTSSAIQTPAPTTP